MKKIKLGINLEFVRHADKPFEWGVQTAAELGYEYVEPMVHWGRELLSEAAEYETFGETPVQVTPGVEFHVINRVWSPGESLNFNMSMPWRFIRGFAAQDGKVALLRGPVVYCIGTAQNAELLKTYPKPGDDLVFDVSSFGTPVLDASARPDGRKVVAKARPRAAMDYGLPVNYFRKNGGWLTGFIKSERLQPLD